MLVFFVGGGKLKHIFLVVILAGLLLFLMLSIKSSYQSDRFKCLKDPSYSAQDKCYQINQSLIAVGSGGWFGRGLGQSRQKFMYLPEVWGDSIFSIAAEEIGFIFSSLLLLLFLFIFYRGLLIARGAPDLYGRTLATGIVVWLAVQTFLNIGGMINLIPMTGVPLPFISAGGSALLSALIAMGILVNISKQTRGAQRS
jgi:cell division protein FtsW